MPEGIIVDGQRVLTAGVYVENRYSELASEATGQGVVAVVGDFPFLKQNTPYVSTSKASLETLIAPNEPDIMRIARVCFKPFRTAVVGQGAPAAVVLISPSATTQATGELPTTAGLGYGPSIESTIWGPRGNSTYWSMTYRPTVPGFRVDILNRGFTERIEADQEDGAITIAYDYTLPAVVTVATAGYGFDDAGAGSGSLNLNKSNDTLYVDFQRVLPDTAVVNSTTESWFPDGPVSGPVTTYVDAGATISGLGTKVTAKVVGFDADGVPATEYLEMVGPFVSSVSEVGTTSWSAITSVTFYTDAGVLTGDVGVNGRCFVLNEAAGTTYVADAISRISTGKGFLVTTDSTRVARIPVAKLDELVSSNVTTSLSGTNATISAGLWSLQSAIEEQSQLVDLNVASDEWFAPVALWSGSTGYVEGDVVRYDDVWYVCISANTGETPDDVGSTYWEAYTATGTSRFDIVLGGGGHASALTNEWEAAFNELLFSDVTAVVPFSTDDTIIEFLAAHVNKSFGKYQNERTGYYGVPALSTYATLKAKASKQNSERLQRCFEQPKIVQYNGRTETQDTYWAALMLAAAANSNRRRSLDKWQPDFVDVVRNAAISSPEYNDAMIDLGYSTFYRWPNQPVKLLLECTTWLSDNNVYRTAAAAVRSTVDLQRDIRAYAERTIEGADTIEGTAAAIVAGVAQRLDQLAYDRVIASYNRNSITVTEYDTYFEIGFEYAPNGTKSYVKIIATVARPTAAA